MFHVSCYWERICFFSILSSSWKEYNGKNIVLVQQNHLKNTAANIYGSSHFGKMATNFRRVMLLVVVVVVVVVAVVVVVVLLLVLLTSSS